MSYTALIGVEIHAELLTKTKIFCACENSFAGEPNTRCCPVCCGMPGSLPVLNKKVVEYAILAGKALGCKINELSFFDRKNYFYPDLPKAYQITQARVPLCVDGEVLGVKIDRIHIEEDAGKLIHSDNCSFVDFNRCGVPLIEIVTAPQITSPSMASQLVQEIAQRLQYAGVCDGKMEQGSLRADVNVSVSANGIKGTRTELKNINSFKKIEKAVYAEIRRQTALLESGQAVVSQTLRYNEGSDTIIAMRKKEDSNDYRYFPEPDLPALCLERSYIDKIAFTLAVMPQQKAEQYQKLGLSKVDIDALLAKPWIAALFDGLIKKGATPKISSTIILSHLLWLENPQSIDRDRLFEVAELVREQKVAPHNIKALLALVAESNKEVLELAKQHNLILQNDMTLAKDTAKQVLEQNPKAVEQYKQGDLKVFGFLMGQCMRIMGKSANPKQLEQVLKELL